MGRAIPPEKIPAQKSCIFVPTPIIGSSASKAGAGASAPAAGRWERAAPVNSSARRRKNQAEGAPIFGKAEIFAYPLLA